MKSRLKLAALMMAMLVGATNTNKVYAQANVVEDQEIFDETVLSKCEYVKALESINIYDSINKTNIIGSMKVGMSYPLCCLLDEGYYEIRYGNTCGYVDCISVMLYLNMILKI